MKTIYDRLNKVYDKTLLDQKDIRKHYRTICDLLEEYQIPHDGKSDDAVIQNEIVYESLLVKRQFEDVFFDTYVKMFDYWYDLNYLERKAQMNVDVERFVKELRHFEADGETIYMPAFAPGFNHLYHTEIVLSGIHTGRYGNGINSSLCQLMKRMVKEIPKLQRIRISSIEMNEITDELLEFIKGEEKIARHLHIPVQSANTTVLKNMNRPYTIAWFMERVDYIRSLIPDISISSDVITGFPQESEEQFQDTLDNIARMRLSFLHVFPYSRRDHTAAAQMSGHLENKIKKERASRLANLSKQLYTAYKQNFIGKEVSVIFEKEKDGKLIGHSSEYLEVAAAAPLAWLHTMHTVRITALDGDLLVGCPLKEESYEAVSNV